MLGLGEDEENDEKKDAENDTTSSRSRSSPRSPADAAADVAASSLPLWRCLELTWARSSYYGASPKRMERLLRAASSVVVDVVGVAIPGEELLSSWPAISASSSSSSSSSADDAFALSTAVSAASAAAASARAVVAALGAFKAPFFSARAAAGSGDVAYYPRGWPIDAEAVFGDNDEEKKKKRGNQEELDDDDFDEEDEYSSYSLISLDAAARRAAAVADAFGAAAAYCRASRADLGTAMTVGTRRVAVDFDAVSSAGTKASTTLTRAEEGAKDNEIDSFASSSSPVDPLDASDARFEDAVLIPLSSVLPELDRRLGSLVRLALEADGIGGGGGGIAGSSNSTINDASSSPCCLERALRNGEALAAAECLLEERPAAAAALRAASPALWRALEFDAESALAELRAGRGAAEAAAKWSVDDGGGGEKTSPPPPPPFLPRGAPPAAGAIAWARGLAERVASRASRLRALLNQTGGVSPSAAAAAACAEAAVAAAAEALAEFEAGILKEWSASAGEAASSGLAAPVLRLLQVEEGEEEGKLAFPRAAANVGRRLDALLRETRAMLSLPPLTSSSSSSSSSSIEIPPQALAAYERASDVRNAELAIDAATEAAAALSARLFCSGGEEQEEEGKEGDAAAEEEEEATSIPPSALPLFEPRLAAVRWAICKGLNGSVTWSDSEAVAEYAASLSSAVERASWAAAAVAKALEAPRRLRRTWGRRSPLRNPPVVHSLFARKDARPLTLPELDAAVETGLAARRAATAAASAEALAAVACARDQLEPEEEAMKASSSKDSSSSSSHFHWLDFEQTVREEVARAAEEVAVCGAMAVTAALEGSDAVVAASAADGDGDDAVAAASSSSSAAPTLLEIELDIGIDGSPVFVPSIDGSGSAPSSSSSTTSSPAASSNHHQHQTHRASSSALPARRSSVTVHAVSPVAHSSV